ncbi:hypothetical protein, partial [Burkholderia cenocepacia]|uniref:hypothetical protein n=1 Tax=Burkholderia cenocepacia TaxID=95486 RepID=UPI001ED8ED29
LSPAIQLLIDRIFYQDAISSPQLCRPETSARPLFAIPIRLQESSLTDGARLADDVAMVDDGRC